MSNITVNRQGPEVFQDNEQGYQDSYTRNRDYKPPMPKPIEYRVYAVWGVVFVGFLVVFFVVYSLWKFAYCFSGARFTTCQALDTAEPIAFAVVFFTPVMLFVVTVMIKLWTRARYDNATANKANLVLNRYGDNEPADLWDRLDIDSVLQLLETRYASAAGVERVVAQYKVYRGVNSLSISSNAKESSTPLLEGPQDAVLKPIPSNEWLLWLNEQPHILFGAATGEGKTTTAKAVLNMRISRGDQLFIIDPHSDDWYGLPVRGGGENWPDVADAIFAVYQEYELRQQLRHAYLLQHGEAMTVTAHQAITVLVDEAYLICLHLNTGNRKNQINYWQMLTEVLGSGARKVNISVVLLSQTTNVEDIDLSGPMRRNFARVALDAGAIKLMIVQEEKEPAHRQALYESLIGMQYPATTVIDSRVVLLDRTGLDTIADQPVDAKSRLWIPSSVPKKDSQLSPNGGSSGDGTGDAALLQELIALHRQGFTRDQARSAHGLTFRNDLWTLAGEILSSQNSASQ